MRPQPCLIAYQQGDHYLYLRCHSQSNHNQRGTLPLLQKNYPSQQQAYRLIMLGDLLSFDKDGVQIEHPRLRHSLDRPQHQLAESESTLFDIARQQSITHIYTYRGRRWKVDII